MPRRSASLVWDRGLRGFLDCADATHTRRCVLRATGILRSPCQPNRMVTVIGTAQNSQGVGIATGVDLTLTDDEAVLSELILSPGTLFSTFRSDKTAYAFRVPSGATEVTVTASPDIVGASVTITQADANSIANGHQVDVSTPPDTIRIVVSPQTGTATLTYTVFAGNYIDYDADGNDLIEIGSEQTGLAQLDAIRYDLNGDGAAADRDIVKYAAAFPNHPPGMGCEHTCTGYELTANLDFDENGDAQITGAGDPTYWNSGAGWLPIGNSSTNYTANFYGNGHTISNLFINRQNDDSNGLFGHASGSNTIRNVGLIDANVTGRYRNGTLVGTFEGSNQIINSYATGRVSAIGGGGLVGLLNGASIVASYASTALSSTGGLVNAIVDGTIAASYATGTVVTTAYNRPTGGLVASVTRNATITASYATGAASSKDTSRTGGLVGFHYGWGTVTVINSYYDGGTTGQRDTGKGLTKTTAQLQMPTGYTDIYKTWDDRDLDGDNDADDAWDFGAADQYPVLKFGRDAAAIAAQFAVQPPGVPQGVTLTPKADTLVVSWTAVNYATGYKVQWKSGRETYDAASRQSTVSGTATVGEDYTALAADTLTFSPGTTRQTLAILVTGDGADELNETVVITLRSPTNAIFAGNEETLAGIGTIIDDDSAVAALVLSPASISENGGVSTVTATLGSHRNHGDDDHDSVGRGGLYGGFGLDHRHRRRTDGTRIPKTRR